MAPTREVQAPRHAPRWRRVATLLALVTYSACAAAQTVVDEVAEAGGIRAYFGMVPAALLDQALVNHERSRKAWGREGPLPDAHHLLVALFDAETGTRIEDAVVEVVHLAPSGGGTPTRLDPLPMGSAQVYGGLLRLSGPPVHEFEIHARRPGAAKPVIFHWRYDAGH